MEPLKNLYSAEWLDQLITDIGRHAPDFPAKQFRSAVLNTSWKSLELKQRSTRIAEELGKFLPGSFREQTALLLEATRGYRGFQAVAFSEFVAVYGLEDPDFSRTALEQFTCLCTAEFAVRPFLSSDLESTLGWFRKWATHPDEHVRRLASEGIRPRLPWGAGVPELKKDPEPILEVLEHLYLDESEYVRRSVANNLNDISKDHPDRVLEFVGQLDWQAPYTEKLAKHALRTLLKKGDKRALDLFGYHDAVTLECKGIHSNKDRYSMGEEMVWQSELQARGTGRLRLEYRLNFIKANGSPGPKIFQLGEHVIEGKKRILLKRKYAFRDLSTRKHYPGKHRLELIANGKVVATLQVHLA